MRPLTAADRTPEPGDVLEHERRGLVLCTRERVGYRSTGRSKEWVILENTLEFVYIWRADGGPVTTD